MTVRRKTVLLLLILTLCLVLDQWAKVIAREQLAALPPISLLNNIIRLEYVENTGAFLGLGANLPIAARTAIFTVMVGIVLCVTLLYLFTNHDLAPLALTAGGLVVAGGLGNLIDRFTRGGAVTDFLNIGIGSLRTGIFNVADVFIMVGAGMLLLDTLRRPQVKSDPVEDCAT